MKVLQIKVGGRMLFGRSLKLLANVANLQCRLRQEPIDFDKEAKCVTDTSWLIHLACKAGVFCCAIDLDFRMTERWGESKNDSVQ